MYVIGLAAKAGHGKDFISKIIQRVAKEKFGLNFGIFALADPLKASVFGENKDLSYEDVYYNKPPEIRHLLQQRGTEEGRLKYGEDVWVRQVYAYIRRFEENFPFVDGIIISDVRFPNEADFVEFGGKPRALAERELDLPYLPSAASYDEYAAEVKFQLEQEKKNNSNGFCFYIVSDRPTLTGEAAEHASETAFDNLDKKQYFSGLFYNWEGTTEAALEDQVVSILLNIVEGRF